MNGQMNHGGEEIAPVIPLFGRRAHAPQPPENTWVTDENPVDITDEDGWWVDPEANPVRPLSSARSAGDAGDEAGSRRRHPTSAPIPLPTDRVSRPTLMRASDLTKPVEERSPQPIPGSVVSDDAPPAASRRGRGSPTTPAGDRRQSRSRPRLRVIDSADAADEPPALSIEQQREQAEAALLKKLRGKGMSISEARSYLRGLGYDDEIHNAVVDACIERRYLDDAALAEQIVYAGSTRKGQGRRAIALALSSRGIERDVVNTALAQLPDDDEERALEFARTKAHSLSRLEPDVALRRLMGQLARRGFSGSVAREAAQQALREVSKPRFR